MKFIQQLNESKLIPTASSFRKYTGKQIAELAYMHLVGLRILLCENSAMHKAQTYARRTAQYNGFSHHYSSETDLYLIFHALVDEQVELRMPEASREFLQGLYFDDGQMVRWLKAEANNTSAAETMARRIFVTMDSHFGIKDSSLRAIRRLVLDWPRLTVREKKLALTRLMQYMRSRCRMSDILAELEILADEVGLEIAGVCNSETGEGCDAADSAHSASAPKKGNLMRTLATVAGAAVGYHLGKKMHEDATAGATAAADIAPNVQPLGQVQRRVPKKKQ